MNLNQITIPVTDVVKSIEFYQKLGLKLIVHTHDAYARFECTPGGSTLSLHKSDSITNGERAVLYFEREDLDDYVAKLIKEGIVFEHLPKDQRWLWREAKLLDPDGNPLIIYYAGENRINPPWKKQDD